jgi:hypothetical protein
VTGKTQGSTAPNQSRQHAQSMPSQKSIDPFSAERRRIC